MSRRLIRGIFESRQEKLDYSLLVTPVSFILFSNIGKTYALLKGRVEKTDPHSADYPLTPVRGLLYGLVRGLPCGLP